MVGVIWKSGWFRIHEPVFQAETIKSLGQLIQCEKHREWGN